MPYSTVLWYCPMVLSYGTVDLSWYRYHKQVKQVPRRSYIVHSRRCVVGPFMRVLRTMVHV
jgi:hypothetical protein